jgi:hypothetical protein
MYGVSVNKHSVLVAVCCTEADDAVLASMLTTNDPRCLGVSTTAHAHSNLQRSSSGYRVRRTSKWASAESAACLLLPATLELWRLQSESAVL